MLRRHVIEDFYENKKRIRIQNEPILFFFFSFIFFCSFDCPNRSDEKLAHDEYTRFYMMERFGNTLMSVTRRWGSGSFGGQLMGFGGTCPLDRGRTGRARGMVCGGGEVRTCVTLSPSGTTGLVRLGISFLKFNCSGFVRQV
jgi:hypothetical protein